MSQLERRISTAVAPDAVRGTGPQPRRVHAGTSADTAAGPVAETLRTAVELAKPGIVKMVLVAAGVGFAMGSFGATVVAPGQFFLTAAVCLLGTALSAAGANALNQVAEAARDARMPRTADRPVASGRVSVRRGLAISSAMALAGVAILLLGANPFAAAVSALTILTYMAAYTPLKPVTPLSTLVGAIPGALPPVVGWAAAAGMRGAPLGGLAEPGAWSLFALMFVWQVPHVMAISWKYRDEYAAGGYRVLPSVDPTGRRTAFTALVWSLALVPISLVPVGAMAGVLGWAYAGVAFLAGLVMAWCSFVLLRDRTDAAARRLFFASIIHLPVVLLVMVGDAFARVVV